MRKSSKKWPIFIRSYHVCPIDPEDEDQRKRYMPDGVHPNDSGQELIYHLLRNLLKEL